MGFLRRALPYLIGLGQLQRVVGKIEHVRRCFTRGESALTTRDRAGAFSCNTADKWQGCEIGMKWKKKRSEARRDSPLPCRRRRGVLGLAHPRLPPSVPSFRALLRVQGYLFTPSSKHICRCPGGRHRHQARRQVEASHTSLPPCSLPDIFIFSSACPINTPWPCQVLLTAQCWAFLIMFGRPGLLVAVWVSVLYRSMSPNGNSSLSRILFTRVAVASHHHPFPSVNPCCSVSKRHCHPISRLLPFVQTRSHRRSIEC